LAGGLGSLGYGGGGHCGAERLAGGDHVLLLKSRPGGGGGGHVFLGSSLPVVVYVVVFVVVFVMVFAVVFVVVNNFVFPAH
jgi:hypothetical protein